MVAAAAEALGRRIFPLDSFASLSLSRSSLSLSSLSFWSLSSSFAAFVAASRHLLNSAYSFFVLVSLLPREKYDAAALYRRSAAVAFPARYRALVLPFSSFSAASASSKASVLCQFSHY